jgi:PAS domain S-box-containing protein
MDKINSCFARRKTNWSATYRHKCADGSYKFVYDRGYVVYDDNKPLRMTGALQDIDQLMKAIEEIRKLSLVASKTDNLVVITNAQDQIEWVNESFIKLMGYALEEVQGKSPLDIIAGRDTDRSIVHRIGKRLAHGGTVSEELLVYSKQGKPLWWKLNINPVFDKKEKVSNFISVITDVSIHKEYEKNITAIAREQSHLIGNANAIIFGVDRNGFVNEWNKLAADTSGLAKNDILGKKLLDTLIHPDDQHSTEKLILEVLKGKPVSQVEFPIISRTGEKLILLLSATPRRKASEEIVGLLAVGQDITELTEYKASLEVKVAERTSELQVAFQKEKELATLKSRFASMVSHEFRTPLSTIKLSVSYLNKYRHRLTDEEITRKFDTVHHQVEHMTHMLEDILTLGKAAESKIQIFKSRVSLCRFFKQIIEEVENSFNGSHTIHLTPHSPLDEIETDDALLRNIFINLLTNAVKFSPDATDVFIDTHQQNGHIQIHVKDCGVGIPDSELADIFEPFNRGSNAETIQGTGLGLSIVKKAVDLVGGTLTVKSELGVGSVFSVTLPVS